MGIMDKKIETTIMGLPLWAEVSRSEYGTSAMGP